jgi:acid phosphatase class B
VRHLLVSIATRQIADRHPEHSIAFADSAKTPPNASGMQGAVGVFMKTLSSLFHPACLALVAATAACSVPVTSQDEEPEATEDALSADASTYSFRCSSAAGSAKVAIVARDGAFELTATAGATTLFAARDQRPSLNARIEDGASSAVNEYIDFNPKGLETVPVDGPKAIELDLVAKAQAYYAKKLTYRDGATTIELSCRVDNAKATRFLKLNTVSAVDMTGVSAVAFDIDDTLAFTTPTFARAFATGGTPKPEDVLFWTHTNGCDQGCASETITLADGTTKLLPANVASTAKSKARELVALHKAKGHKVYAITARPDVNGEALRDYVQAELGIARADVFFEPDMDQPGNPKGKTDRIESLDIDVFYGDSDSDITDSAKAFVGAGGVRSKEVRAVRFLRSPKSSNRKAGKLNKYHPGYYGEAILRGTYE